MKYRDSEGNLQEIYLPPTGDTLPIGSVVDYDGDTVPANWELVEDVITDGVPIKTGYKYNGKDVYRLHKNLGYLPGDALGDEPIAIGISNYTIISMPKIMYLNPNDTTYGQRYYPNPFLGSSNINTWLANKGYAYVTCSAGRNNLQLIIDIEFIYND